MERRLTTFLSDQQRHARAGRLLPPPRHENAFGNKVTRRVRDGGKPLHEWHELEVRPGPEAVGKPKLGPPPQAQRLPLASQTIPSYL